MKNLAILSCLLSASVNAQFHETNALNLQTQALLEEKKVAEEVAAATIAEMDSAVTTMEEAEKEAAFQEALEKGELFAPDGTPIPENQNNGVRPLDPRTPLTFGDAFARVNDVEEEVAQAVLDSGLSSTELALLDSMQAQDTNETEVVHDDEFDTMIVVSIPPRNMCGINLEQAAQWCGPTCDPQLKFCTLGAANFYGFTDYVKPDGQIENWGTCFESVSCNIVEEHELILEEGDACRTRKINNPCPNPCDCYRNRVKQQICHQVCAKTDSLSIAACHVKRKSGKRRRERKIARALDETDACSFNVYYDHPLMHSEGLEAESLPGLFETF